MGKRGGPSKRHLIEPFKDELGTVPDAVIAKKAGVSAGTVFNVRNEMGIPGYRAVKGKRRRQKPSKPAESETRRAKKPGRRSVLDQYRKVLGTMPDRVIADTAGVSRSAVAAYRRRHGKGISASTNTGPQPKVTDQRWSEASRR